MKNTCNFEGCDKSFPCYAKLQDHMNAHLGIRPFKCDICQKKFYSKKQLWAHNQIHSSNPIKCPQCSMVITMKGNIKKHLKTCSRIYRCECCGKIYKKKFYYEQHLLNNHTAKKAKLEGSTPKTPDENSKKHLESANVETCQICKAEYKGLRNLKAHYRSVHEKYRFQCVFCDKNFSYNVSLRKHILREHQSS